MTFLIIIFTIYIGCIETIYRSNKPYRCDVLVRMRTNFLSTSFGKMTHTFTLDLNYLYTLKDKIVPILFSIKFPRK